MTLINESGVYNAIFGSKKEKAKEFRKYVTSVILPKIRRTGGYNLPAQTEYVLPKNYVEALEFLVVAEKEKQMLLEENAVLKPKAEFADNVLNSTDWYDMKNVAKILWNKYNFKIGRNKLFQALRDMKVLMEDPNKNESYQQFVTRGLFKVFVDKIEKDETVLYVRHTVASNKGIEFIYKILIKNNIQQDFDLVEDSE